MQKNADALCLKIAHSFTSVYALYCARNGQYCELISVMKNHF